MEEKARTASNGRPARAYARNSSENRSRESAEVGRSDSRERSSGKSRALASEPARMRRDSERCVNPGSAAAKRKNRSEGRGGYGSGGGRLPRPRA
jgi:hypothetical protein